MKQRLSTIKYVITAILCGCLFLTACNKNNGHIQTEEPKKMDISGEWTLVSTSSNEKNKIDISVFVAFDGTNNTFEVYQKIGKGHYRHLEGTYKLTDDVLSGTYSDNETFACDYKVTLEGDKMTMVTIETDPLETNLYERAAIPAEVKQDAKDFGPTVKASDTIRAL